MFLTDAQKQWRSLAAGWQGVDWVLVALPVALTAFGAVVIHSIQRNTDDSHYGLNHVVLGVIGLGLALWVARSRYEHLRNWQWIIYGIVNLLLVAVMFIGTVGGGAQSWIAVGSFYVQPSEFAKLSVIITLAAMLSSRDASTLWGVGSAIAVIVLPWLLVFIQPDLGTSLVFGAIALAMLYWANCNPGWLVLFISPLVAAIMFHMLLPGWLVWSLAMGLIAWFTLPWRWFSTVVATAINLVSGKLGDVVWGLLEDYQKDRLVLFLDPDKDPLGGGYHLIQSRIAIGAGKLWGQGLGQGTQTQLNFIPEQHTDFIFSAVGEEWGFVGSMVVILAYWLICFRLVIIAQNAKDDFGSLLVIGVLAMIVFQVVVNIGMTMGLAPITGIPLPWLSYGRSALLTNFIALGMVESVANFRHRLKFTD
ncbi:MULTISPECIES: rod shape-determining protein RodA [Cyanophyceae]|uniref:rod shape-determining protein RodA n=1 Tax=Cyanophyceae TaxID=3028117 RepID=UPI001685E054|nr:MULTISPECIES: rod shape-determining protein RodA [Cyanophyceae]MBD1914782.1 rod shape-determining protein RodA [Phormidium sp. FACHB-77]MBD2030885.1 rod shape-determining protein RodA [Phormidium sp. FACHB-322]MBD2052483.1 rod shape-determining protein RodA [Leptolyngbya sp. FACHB-60]